MKSYKQRTIDGCKELIKRYTENNPSYRCPFCNIYRVGNDRKGCVGCFMHKIKIFNNGHYGCTTFSSSITAAFMYNKTQKQRLRRAGFHKKCIPILQKIDAKYFTPTGWKEAAFKKIKRKW